jgi:hypothetical protein
MLTVPLGCRLRRSEVAALTLKHIQQRDNRWCIADCRQARAGEHDPGADMGKGRRRRLDRCGH